jgi:hypothetical protein
VRAGVICLKVHNRGLNFIPTIPHPYLCNINLSANEITIKLQRSQALREEHIKNVTFPISVTVSTVKHNVLQQQHNVMETGWGVLRGLCIFNLGTRYEAVRFITRLLCPHYPLNKGLSGLQSQSGRQKVKNVSEEFQLSPS